MYQHISKVELNIKLIVFADNVIIEFQLIEEQRWQKILNDLWKWNGLLAVSEKHKYFNLAWEG